MALLKLPAQHARHHRHFHATAPTVPTPSSSPATFPRCGCATPRRRCGPICPFSPPTQNSRNSSKASSGARRAASSPIPTRTPSCPTSPAAEPLSWSKTDHTEMKPGVGERKWEVDSLCYPVRLAHEYWRITHDTKPFGAEWARAMHAILETFKAQQRKTSRGPYHFQREAFSPYDTLSEDGYGNPARPHRAHSLWLPPLRRCVHLPAQYSRQFLRREDTGTHRRDAH